MTNEQIERFLDTFEYLSYGVNKIGDGVKSIAFYIWLPLYIAFLAVLTLCAIGAYLYLF